MIRGIEALLLSTENAKKLADFYQKKVGLKLTESMEIGEKGEKGYSFEWKGFGNLYILDHSKIKGKNKQASRIMFNLEVSQIEKEVKRLKKAKVKVVKDLYHMQEYGMIATFEDPDGNYFQLVQTRPD